MKKRFNQNQRLKADARISSRALNILAIDTKKFKKGTTYSVSEKNVSLKRSFLERLKLKSKDAKSTFKKSKSIKQTIDTFLDTDLQGYYERGFLSDEKDGIDRGKITIKKKRTLL